MPSGKVQRIEPFNPLHTKKLGESVANELLKGDVLPLPPATPFIGAGVYALYYEGGFGLYAELAERNRGGRYGWPIYVGKAVPAGARKGGYGLGTSPGQVLFKRLAEHASSVDQAENLELADFRCRFLVVDDIWIPLAEALLIELFTPLWNTKIDGFGNHDPGSGRHRQQRSAWDELRPGRSWATRLQPFAGADRISEAIPEYLKTASERVDELAAAATGTVAHGGPSSTGGAGR